MGEKKSLNHYFIFCRFIGNRHHDNMPNAEMRRLMGPEGGSMSVTISTRRQKLVSYVGLFYLKSCFWGVLDLGTVSSECFFFFSTFFVFVLFCAMVKPERQIKPMGTYQQCIWTVNTDDMPFSLKLWMRQLLLYGKKKWNKLFKQGA